MIIIAGGVCLIIKKRFDISRVATIIIEISVVVYCAITYNAFSNAICLVCSGSA